MTGLFTKVSTPHEWAILQHIHRHDPELCPRPVSASLDTITMTVIPGIPLAAPLTQPQIEALVTAIRRLWSIPFDGPWQGDLPFARRLTALPPPRSP